MSRLLVISNHYLTFVKDQIECFASEFDNIDVFVRQNSIKNVFLNKSNIDTIAKPENVFIKPTPLVYFPYKDFYKLAGISHFKSVNKHIDRYRNNYDIIHCHFSWTSGFVGKMIHEEIDKPLIITAHGYDIYSLPFINKGWGKLIKDVLNSSDHIITVSQNNNECIKKLNVSTPVTVIPNGFRSDLFYPRDQTECRKQLGLPLDKKIILTVGNLVEIKGHKHLIDAVKRITSNRDDILCIIVGSGHLKGTLERQIRSLGLEQYVRLVGGKPHNEIPFWMNASDLFVLPSLQESFGVVQIEAMACGKPVIGTNVGGVPEIITSEEFGLLVEPEDTESLSEKIIAGLCMNWDQKKIISYMEQFSWEHVTHQIMNVFKRVSSNY